MPHISFSSFKDFKTCPYKFKLTWVDKIGKFAGNEHTTFGNALHSVLEYQVQNKVPENFTTWEDFFDKEFLRFIKGALAGGAEKFDKKLITEMRAQGRVLIPLAMPALREKFGNFQLLGSELNLMEPINEYKKASFDFKGFIDLVVGTEDGKVHVVDFKTCSWGWDARHRSDKMTVYQLVFYKHYLSQKWDINPDDIDVHFALLKRTAKTNHVEFVDITSGKKRNENALKELLTVVSNYHNMHFMKNKVSCATCPFYKTEWCK